MAEVHCKQDTVVEWENRQATRRSKPMLNPWGRNWSTCSQSKFDPSHRLQCQMQWPRPILNHMESVLRVKLTCHKSILSRAVNRNKISTSSHGTKCLSLSLSECLSNSNITLSHTTKCCWCPSCQTNHRRCRGRRCSGRCRRRACARCRRS